MSLEDIFDKFCPPVIPTTKLPGKLKIYSTQSRDLDDKESFQQQRMEKNKYRKEHFKSFWVQISPS